MGEKLFVVACIPAFNEENMIANVILTTKKYVDKVIVCDDGSSDMTAEIAWKLGADVLRHETNMGKGAALRSLFSRASMLNPDVVVTLDGDGQHESKQISDLLKPIIEGKADIVVGSRYVNGSVSDIPTYRKVGLGVANWLSRRTANLNVGDTQSGFRAYSPKALQLVSSTESNGYGADTEILTLAAKEGLRIVEVPVTVKYDLPVKTSKKAPMFHGMELVSSILKLIVEDRPLLLLGLPGILVLMLGVFFGIWTLQVYTVEHYVITNMALISIGLVLIGLFTVFTSIMLYALTRLARKTNNGNH